MGWRPKTCDVESSEVQVWRGTNFIARKMVRCLHESSMAHGWFWRHAMLMLGATVFRDLWCLLALPIKQSRWQPFRQLAKAVLKWTLTCCQLRVYRKLQDMHWPLCNQQNDFHPSFIISSCDFMYLINLALPWIFPWQCGIQLCHSTGCVPEWLDGRGSLCLWCLGSQWFV